MMRKKQSALDTEIHWPLQVFYDGQCSVCAAEMARYRILDTAGRLSFVDICKDEFVAENFGRSAADFQRQMHVCDASGVFWVGAAAFPVIWQALPGRGYRWRVRFFRWPGVVLLVHAGYALFARWRHLLPKTTRRCGDQDCKLK